MNLIVDDTSVFVLWDQFLIIGLETTMHMYQFAYMIEQLLGIPFEMQLDEHPWKDAIAIPPTSENTPLLLQDDRVYSLSHLIYYTALDNTTGVRHWIYKNEKSPSHISKKIKNAFSPVQYCWAIKDITDNKDILFETIKNKLSANPKVLFIQQMATNDIENLPLLSYLLENS